MNKMAKELRRCKTSGEIASGPPWFKQVFNGGSSLSPFATQPLAQDQRYRDTIYELYTAGTFLFHVDDEPMRRSRKESVRIHAVTNGQV